MTEQSSLLVAHKLFFYSDNDEESFFAWLKKIDCISSLRGEGFDVLITLKGEKIDDESLRDFIALFSRYNVDLSQLSRFESDENRLWFKDPQKYWYHSIFGGT